MIKHLKGIGKMNAEDLFYKYQNSMRRLEDEKESLERKKQKLENRKERIQAREIEDRVCVDELLNTWGDCQDSGNFRADFEDCMDKVYQGQNQREVQVQEEFRCVLQAIAICENDYKEEYSSLLKEEGEWQEK